MVIRSAIRPAVRSPLRGSLESKWGADNGLSVSAPSSIIFADGDQPIYLADWQSHNLLAESDDLSGWTSSLNISAGGTPPAPYTTFTRFTAAGTAPATTTGQAYSPGITLPAANTDYAFELVFKTVDADYAYIYAFGFGSIGRMWIDLSTGATSNVSGALALRSFHQDVDTGVYKAVLYVRVGTNLSGNLLFGISDAAGSETVTAEKACDVTGAVIRYASADPTYSETTGTADTPVASYGAFTLADAQYDSGADSYNATATITAGNLTVSPSFETGGENALTYSTGDGDADTTFTVTGATLDDLNAALNKLAVDGLSGQTANVTVEWLHPSTTRTASKTISVTSVQTIAAQSFEFGALTREGAGAVTVVSTADTPSFSITAGDASGHWQINSSTGALSPSATGEDALTGTYNLTVSDGSNSNTITCTCTGNNSDGVDLTKAATVNDGTELEAVVTTSFVSSEARAILCRPGDYTVASTCFKNKALANTLTVTRAETTLPVFLDGVAVDNIDNLSLTRIRFYTEETVSTVRLVEMLNACADLSITNCEMAGATFDPTADWSASEPNQVIGIYSSGVGAAGLTIADNTLEYLNVGTSFAASGTVSVARNLVRYCYEDALKYAHAGGGAYPSLTFEDNISYDIVGKQTDTTSPPHCDHIQVLAQASAPHDMEGPFIRRNVLMQTSSGRGDGQGIFIRFLSPVIFTVNCSTAFTTPDQVVTSSSGGTGKLVSAVSAGGSVTMQLYAVSGTFNTSDTLTGASDGSATLTTVDKAAQNYCNAVIQDNFIISGLANGIFLASVGSDAVIEGNTVVGRSADGVVNSIRAGEYGVEAGGSVLVRDNIAEAIAADDGSSLTQINNVVLGNGGATIPYSDVFDGISGSFDPATVAEALTMFSMKASGDAEAEPSNPNIGSVGTGYVDFDANTSDHPRREAGFDASAQDWGNDVDVTLDAAVTSDLVQLTGLSATGALVTVSGGTSPSFNVYSDAGTTLVASSVTSYIVPDDYYIRINDTASSSNSTQVDVTINVGSTTGTYSHTTVSGVVVPVAVDNQATAYIMSGAISATGSGVGIISFWYKNNEASWNATKCLWEFTNSTTDTLRILTAASGKLSITAKNSGGTGIISCSSGGTMTVGNWYHHLIAFDLASPADFEWYVHSTSGLITGGSSPTESLLTSDGVVADLDDSGIFARYNGAIPNDCSLFELFVHLGDTLDITSAPNRAKFYNGSSYVNLGSDGSTPLGLQPQFFFSGVSSHNDFLTNRGSVSGTWSETNTLADDTAPVS